MIPLKYICEIRNYPYIAFVALCLISLTYISIAPIYWVDFMFLPLGIMLHSIRYFWGIYWLKNGYQLSKGISGSNYNKRKILALVGNLSTKWVILLYKAIVVLLPNRAVRILLVGSYQCNFLNWVRSPKKGCYA